VVAVVVPVEMAAMGTPAAVERRRVPVAPVWSIPIRERPSPTAVAVAVETRVVRRHLVESGVARSAHTTTVRREHLDRALMDSAAAVVEPLTTPI